MNFIKFLDIDDKLEAARKIGEYFAVFNKDLVNYYKNCKMPRIIEISDYMKKEFSDINSIKLINEMVNRYWNEETETFQNMVNNKYNTIIDIYGDNYYTSNDIDTIKELNNMIKEVIFRSIAKLLSNPDMLTIYKYLYQFFIDGKIITDINKIKFIMKYCMKNNENNVEVSYLHNVINLSIKDYPTKFNKIKIDDFDSLFPIDILNVDFYLDDKHLGENYVFRKFNTINEKIREEMCKSYKENLFK